MYSRKQTKDISVAGLVLMYFLSVGIIFFNQHFQILDEGYATFSLLAISKFWAIFINLIFLGTNSFFTGKILTNRDRNINGNIPAFLYLLLHNKVWFLHTLNNYLVSDFFILSSLLFINPRETKQRLNILVFYLAVLFSMGFLIGIHIAYAFIIPVVIFNIFLVSDWRTWVIFLLGFSLPVYLYLTVSWLFDKDPFLYLDVLIKHSVYSVKGLADLKHGEINKWQWADVSIVIILGLLIVSGIREWMDMPSYSARGRQMALFFFLLMFFSLIHYGLIHYWYKRYALSVIALPFSYYVGQLINKVSLKFGYFVLFLWFVLTSFL